MIRMHIDAVFSKGVFLPLEPIELMESERVHLAITQAPKSSIDSLLAHEEMAAAVKEANPNVTLEQVRSLLASIPGNMSDVVSELRQERF